MFKEEGILLDLFQSSVLNFTLLNFSLLSSCTRVRAQAPHALYVFFHLSLKYQLAVPSSFQFCVLEYLVLTSPPQSRLGPIIFLHIFFNSHVIKLGRVSKITSSSQALLSPVIPRKSLFFLWFTVVFYPPHILVLPPFTSGPHIPLFSFLNFPTTMSLVTPSSFRRSS